MWVHFSGTTNTDTIATVTHINSNCNITGKVQAYTDNSVLDYDITVTSWYTHPNVSYLNRAGNFLDTDGQATITKPASITLEYFDVEYNTTNQSISIYLRTTPASVDIFYSSSDLKKRD